MSKPRPSVLRILAGFAGRLALATATGSAVLLAIYLPRQVDRPVTAAERAQAIRFYADAYAKQGDEAGDPRYVKIAEAAAKAAHIERDVAAFARRFSLAGKKVLDVGAGRGYLQDVVEDYTGLDISPSAGRYFHKRFVRGSATAMPFAAGDFDAVWTIWVLEHVPNPEAALVEMRRVVRDGGLLFLQPAWSCTPWHADGYAVRPFSDLGAGGKAIKALLPLEIFVRTLATVPVRAVRLATWRADGGPTRLRYVRLNPNFDTYWMPDSDALNGLDRTEMAMWFLSRGDECLNCDGAFSAGETDQSLIIRVRKSGQRPLISQR